MNINTTIERAISSAAPTLSRAFNLIDEAKNAGYYGLANKVFVYIFRNFEVNMGIEVDATEEQAVSILDSFEFLIDHSSNFEDLNEVIHWNHYHALLTLEWGEDYACIPLPMLSNKTIKHCLRKVKETAPRKEHNRSRKYVYLPSTSWKDSELLFFENYSTDGFFHEEE